MDFLLFSIFNFLLFLFSLLRLLTFSLSLSLSLSLSGRLVAAVDIERWIESRICIKLQFWWRWRRNGGHLFLHLLCLMSARVLSVCLPILSLSLSTSSVPQSRSSFFFCFFFCCTHRSEGTCRTWQMDSFLAIKATTTTNGWIRIHSFTAICNSVRPFLWLHLSLSLSLSECEWEHLYRQTDRQTRSQCQSHCSCH